MSTEDNDRSAGHPARPENATPVTPLSTGVGGEPGPTVESGQDVAQEGPPTGPELTGPELTGPDLARQALAQARAMAGGAVGDDANHAQRAQRRRRRNRRVNLGRTTWSGAGLDDRDPQQVGSVFRALLGERGWHKSLTEARIFTDWATLVGQDVAANCTPVELRAGELRISARSSAWATQIRLLAPTLLAQLSAQLGAGVVARVSVSGPSAPSWKHGRRSVPGARGPRDTYG